MQSIPLKILKSQQDVLTIFTLAVFMNGWKEVKVVQFVGRYVLCERIEFPLLVQSIIFLDS